MPLLRFDVGCGRAGVPPEVGGANGDLSGWFACVSLCEPDLSSAGFGFDAGVLWLAVFSGADDCGDSGKACKTAQGDRSPEAHLLGIYSAAVDTGGDAFCEWPARFAEIPGLLSDRCCQQIQYEGDCARQPALARAFLA